MKILDQVKDLVAGSTVFGQPYEKNGLTLIPASRLSAGGGGGQASADEEGGGGGLQARPAGAFVVKGDDARWMPAVDVNRIIVGAQIVAVVAILSWRSVAKAQARAHTVAR
jgi:uncharacterized spore protein YtfJ